MSEFSENEALEKRASDLSELVERAALLANDGDRSPLYLRASQTFQQTVAGELVLNVPSDNDFYGRRLNLFLSQRVVGYVGSPIVTELTYRPAGWTVAGGVGTVSANCLFDLRDSMRGAYQSAPTSILSAFSAANSQLTITGSLYDTTAFIGGMDFHVDYYLRRGSTMTVRFTPLPAAIPVESTTQYNEYRITAVLHGYKKVRAFL